MQTEILKRESTPAMRLLNDLLNLHDGFDDEGWLKKCRKCMIDMFPREDPFSMLVPSGFDMENVRRLKVHRAFYLILLACFKLNQPLFSEFYIYEWTIWKCSCMSA